MKSAAFLCIVGFFVSVGCGGAKTISLLGGSETVNTRGDAGPRDSGSSKPTCASDADCSAPKAHCDTLTKECVQCMANEQCATLSCNPVSHTCSGCITNADCSAPTPFCDGDDRKCVECSSAAQCSGGQVCAFEAHRCAPECHTNSDCAGSGHPICATASSVCVECTSDADCSTMGLEPHCDLRYGACVECLTDGDCAGGHCETFENRCVECTSNTQCDDGRVCDLFTCH